MNAAIENHYERTSGAVSVYSNFGRHNIDDGTSDPTKPTQCYFRSKDALTGVSIYQTTQIFEGNRVTLGLDYQHIYGKTYYTLKATDEELETSNKQSGESHRNEIAGYVDFRQDVTTWLTVDAGIRLDHHSVTGTECVPQVGVAVRPISTGALKYMVSKGFRNPTMRELYLYPPSNEDLEPERIWNYEISWHHQLQNFTYGANVYYLKGDNMIQTVRSEGKPRNVNTGKIENYGVELEAKYRVNEYLSLNTNHSFLHMKNKIVAAPEYCGYLGANFSIKKLNVLAGLQYINNLYKEVGDNEQKENFCLLNVSVSYAANKTVSLWVRGENLLAQKYEINLGYPMPRASAMMGVNIKF